MIPRSAVSRGVALFFYGRERGPLSEEGRIGRWGCARTCASIHRDVRASYANPDSLSREACNRYGDSIMSRVASNILRI